MDGAADGDEAKMEIESDNDAPACSSKGNEKSKARKHAKPLKPGIIYLSSVPYRLTVKRLREIFSQYGEVGRIYLHSETRTTSTGKKEKRFTEGWVEFKDRKLANRVAASLNKTMVGGRRRSKAYDSLWNLKYLHRFQWVHLNEQLAYEKALHNQRMRTEISQAKREANCFAEQIDKGKELKRLEETVLKKGGLWERYQRQVQQKKSISGKKKKREANVDGDSLLHDIFAKDADS